MISRKIWVGDFLYRGDQLVIAAQTTEEGEPVVRLRSPSAPYGGESATRFELRELTQEERRLIGTIGMLMMPTSLSGIDEQTADLMVKRLLAKKG